VRAVKFREQVAETARRIPWWGISALVHLLVLFILASWKLPVRPLQEAYGTIEVNLKEPEPELPPLDISTRISPEPPAIEPPVERPDLKEIIDKTALSELDKAERTRVMAVDAGVFGARNPDGRAAAVRGGGGATEASENAVEAGLAWLARNQLVTGYWHASTGTAHWADPGVTGLATLAFLGAGYTHRSGMYARTVQRALAYLKAQQDTEGCIAYVDGGKRTGGYMYGHAIGSLALVEAYGMTKDILLREPAERAIDFICLKQNSTGGWRYYADSPDADSSVSGWMIMALRSASLAGLVVPPKTFENARRFLDAVTNKEQGWTAYMPGMQPSSPALIAVGLLCHQYLGMKTDDPYIARAEANLLKFPPQWVKVTDRMETDNLPNTQPAANNYYSWYYANLALHQLRDEAWEKWHPQVRQLLLSIQVRSGKDHGSWPPDTKWALRGGRAYSTALAVLCLEIYYRYAPMYREVVDEVLAAYGDALSAYNHFARLYEKKDPEADQARLAAVEKLKKFLGLSEPKPDKKPDRPALERRNQAAQMLVRLHRVAGEHEQAIALLATFPERFPGALDGPEAVKMLADLYREQAKQLADAGQAEKAKLAKATAVKLYTPLVFRTLGKNAELELWMAEEFYEREEWQKALDIYKARIKAVNFKKLDPASDEGETVAAILARMIDCCSNLRFYNAAGEYLRQLEVLVGPSLATQRQRALLYRKQKQFAAALRLYNAILPRLKEYSKEWWETQYDLLLMAYLDGRSQYVARAIGKLQITHPDLGGEEVKPRLLELLSRAQNG